MFQYISKTTSLLLFDTTLDLLLYTSSIAVIKSVFLLKNSSGLNMGQFQLIFYWNLNNRRWHIQEILFVLVCEVFDTYFSSFLSFKGLLNILYTGYSI